MFVGIIRQATSASSGIAISLVVIELYHVSLAANMVGFLSSSLLVEVLFLGEFFKLTQQHAPVGRQADQHSA